MHDSKKKTRQGGGDHSARITITKNCSRLGCAQADFHFHLFRPRSLIYY